MPIVRVEMIAGRSEEQKQKLAELLTKAMVEAAGAKAEDVFVVFKDVARHDWAVAGTLVSRR